MNTLKYCSLLILSMLCFSSCKGQGSESNDSDNELFVEYLSTFKQQELPLIIDKKDVANFRNLRDSTSELADKFKVFLPTDLDLSYGEFRGVSQLPSNIEFRSVLIMQKFTDRFESTITKIHLVTYDQSGRLIDSKELAGYRIDSWESSSRIEEDYRIEKHLFRYKMHEDQSMTKYLRLEETKNMYEINSGGRITELNTVVTNGYYEISSDGYKLIKLVD